MSSNTGSARIDSIQAIEGQRIHRRVDKRPRARSSPATNETATATTEMRSVSRIPSPKNRQIAGSANIGQVLGRKPCDWRNSVISI